MNLKQIFFIILSCQLQFITSSTHIILTGPPGSGKGTLAQHLTHMYGYTHICIGDRIRSEIHRQTSFGKQIESIVAQGNYIDVPIIAQLVDQEIATCLHAHQSFILDGFPRSPECMAYLKDILQKYDITDIICIRLEADDATCLKRIAGRRVCLSCQGVFNTNLHNLHANDTCLNCAATLVQRSRDDHESAQQRIAYYRKHIEPVINELCNYLHTCIMDTY